MTLTIAYSPCPNDTFMFDALVHKKVSCNNIGFNVVHEDIEELNTLASQVKADVIKISYRHYPSVSKDYQLLTSGSALGYNCGPLLVSKNIYTAADIPNLRIAIPGINTTANFLLSLAYPTATNKTPVLFSDIEDVVLKGEYDAGLLIHENRFTYAQRGLHKIMDMGVWWQDTYHAPIPLGGICIKRSLEDATKKAVNKALQQSVEYAFAHTDDVMPYVRAHAQAMDDNVMQQHIDLYVNRFSVDLGEEGHRAVSTMYDIALKNKMIESITTPIFI